MQVYMTKYVLSSLQQTDIPQISLRLADAVLHVQKGLEIRKPIRDLFEAGKNL